MNDTADVLLFQYDPSRALFSEIRLIEKKQTGLLISKSNKYAFQFQQSRLSYFKDAKVGPLPMCIFLFT